MDNNALYDNFRKQLTNVHAFTVLVVSVLEIIGYAVLVHTGNEFFGIHSKYLHFRVILPILLNILTHVIARLLVRRKDIKRKTRNIIIIAAALATSLIVAIFHKEYVIACCAFVFPMILSSIFNDKKLLNTSFIASFLILLIVSFSFWFEDSLTLTVGINLFILFGFSIIAYLCSLISINFSSLNHDTIEAQEKMNDKLLDEVARDQMTGLYNHNKFLHSLERMVQNKNNIGNSFLVMLDLDDFKSINDTFGHDSGDEVLLFMANTVKKYCVKPDTAYRYGGEEFAVIFRQKNVAQVKTALESMLEDLKNHKFSFSDVPLTFSAGIAEFNGGISADELFDMADDTLYIAKRQGKNQILESKNYVAV